MAGHRPERVAQLLQQAITEMLQRGKIKDPRVGEATVAEVKVTVDLRIAKVYVQVLGGAEAREKTVEGLQAAEAFIRHELRPKLSLKSVPQLLFRGDDTAEKADRVLTLLAQLNRDKEPAPPATPVEEPEREELVESEVDEFEPADLADDEQTDDEIVAEEPPSIRDSSVHESDFDPPAAEPGTAKTPKAKAKAKAKAKPKAKQKAKAKAKPRPKAKAKAKPAKKPAKKTVKKTVKKPASKTAKKTPKAGRPKQ